MKITEQTTLSELMIEMTKIGITFFSVKPQAAGNFIAGVMHIETNEWLVGYGDTIASAIDAVVETLRQREATRAIEPKALHIEGSSLR